MLRWLFRKKTIPEEVRYCPLHPRIVMIRVLSLPPGETKGKLEERWFCRACG